MVTTEDVTFSVYTEVKKFADSINFGFAVTTSIESASSILMDGRDKILLVQESLKDGVFLEASYKIFISFANTIESNALLTTEIVSKFLLAFPKYYNLCIYEAASLKLSPSVYVYTGKKLVVKEVGQELVFMALMQSNLNSIAFKLLGHIK